MAEERNNLQRALEVVAVMCAVVMTTAVCFQWFQARTRSVPHEKRPVPVSNWPELSSLGHRDGPNTAAVTILTFADFECPFCRKFALETLPAVRAAFPGKIAVIMRHWPLDYHRFARPAARASECAAAQGRFKEMHDLLYAKQDSFGLKPFEEFGWDAGVSDSTAFRVCVRDKGDVLAVERDKKAALDGRFSGTPTVIVNGLRLPGVPDSAALASYIRDVLADSKRAEGVR